MNSICHSLLLLLALSHAQPLTLVELEARSECQPGWIELPGYGCYLFDLNWSLDWLQAARNCQKLGGHLVEIETQDEQNGLTSIARIIGEDFWIGLTDIGHDGNYRWMYSGNEVSYTNWAANEPDGGIPQSCVMMFSGYGYDFGWTDIKCTEWSAHPLCEANYYQGRKMY
ncbi:hypothetical protein TCAL_06101 [Tigriopus californicus]|uniref:C-type lectin domain-containing protein n=1 Tax=Tigriopus californicus TaxID=6832 RepID=A0A553P1L9_TIGCA|nr:perlucin-like protein [Tigriopus californicus]TRY71512.1 hypothetical protein TCAL_06101 [Tigriopus californicus]|eukprot:TCALIF_06101-PA protein Name:"Similar to Perlucin-like protein (Mytilus galloprovincialis)" AED:0.14 eAED:0.16 QI:0/0/0/1/1/1/2/0/169